MEQLDYDLPETPVDQFLAPWLEGIHDTLISAPLTRLQVMFQTQDINQRVENTSLRRGIYNSIGLTTRQDGFFSLWRGAFSKIVSYVPIQFVSYLELDKLLLINTPDSNQTRYGAANMKYSSLHNKTNVSETEIHDFNIQLFKKSMYEFLGSHLLLCVNQLVSFPFLLVYTNMAVDLGSKSERQFRSLNDCFRKIYHFKGIRGFYKGFWASYLSDVVFLSILAMIVPWSKLESSTASELQETFSAIEFKEKMNDNKEEGKLGNTGETYAQLSPDMRFLVIYQNIAIAAMCTYPITTISARMMIQAGEKKELYKGLVDCMTKTMKREGLSAFYKGFGVYSLMQAVMLMVNLLENVEIKIQ